MCIDNQNPKRSDPPSDDEVKDESVSKKAKTKEAADAAKEAEKAKAPEVSMAPVGVDWKTLPSIDQQINLMDPGPDSDEDGDGKQVSGGRNQSERRWRSWMSTR